MVSEVKGTLAGKAEGYDMICACMKVQDVVEYINSCLESCVSR